MTTWILVIMLCTRTCQPIQAELYVSKAECSRHVTAISTFNEPRQYCVPLIKN